MDCPQLLTFAAFFLKLLATRSPACRLKTTGRFCAAMTDLRTCHFEMAVSVMRDMCRRNEQTCTDLTASPCNAVERGELIRHDLEILHRSLLDGKLPRNVRWNDALELIEHLGKAEPHGEGEFAFVVGTQRAFFKRPHDHELGVEEASRLRTFLKEAGPGGNKIAPVQPRRVVVVVDHHGAHVYQDFDDRSPAEGVTVRPYDPFHFHHHLVHRKEAHYRGARVPEETSFYEEIAKHLASAVEIVLIGHGTGNSSAVDFLMNYLRTHHSEIAQRVKATETADLSALTQPELEVIAKSHMIAVV